MNIGCVNADYYRNPTLFSAVMIAVLMDTMPTVLDPFNVDVPEYTDDCPLEVRGA
jgi:hypothetical protein